MVSQPWQDAVDPSEDEVWEWLWESVGGSLIHRPKTMCSPTPGYAYGKKIIYTRQIHSVVSCDRKKESL